MVGSYRSIFGSHWFCKLVFVGIALHWRDECVACYRTSHSEYGDFQPVSSWTRFCIGGGSPSRKFCGTEGVSCSRIWCGDFNSYRVRGDLELYYHRNVSGDTIISMHLWAGWISSLPERRYRELGVSVRILLVLSSWSSNFVRGHLPPIFSST